MDDPNSDLRLKFSDLTKKFFLEVKKWNRDTFRAFKEIYVSDAEKKDKKAKHTNKSPDKDPPVVDSLEKKNDDHEKVEKVATAVSALGGSIGITGSVVTVSVGAAAGAHLGLIGLIGAAGGLVIENGAKVSKLLLRKRTLKEFSDGMEKVHIDLDKLNELLILVNDIGLLLKSEIEDASGAVGGATDSKPQTPDANLFLKIYQVLTMFWLKKIVQMVPKTFSNRLIWELRILYELPAEDFDEEALKSIMNRGSLALVRQSMSNAFDEALEPIRDNLANFVEGVSDCVDGSNAAVRYSKEEIANLSISLTGLGLKAFHALGVINGTFNLVGTGMTLKKCWEILKMKRNTNVMARSIVSYLNNIELFLMIKHMAFKNFCGTFDLGCDNKSCSVCYPQTATLSLFRLKPKRIECVQRNRRNYRF